MKEMVCVNCGTKFGMSLTLLEQRKTDGKPFYCPNKCSLFFSESTVGRLEKQIDQLEMQLENARQDVVWYARRCKKLKANAQLMQRRAAGYKGQWMRVKSELEQLGEQGQ